MSGYMMKFKKYQITWTCDTSDGVQENEVFAYLPEGENPQKELWPFLNLAEMDASEHGYAVDVKEVPISGQASI